MSSNAPATDEWGITDGFHDVHGDWHPTSDETRAALRDAMGVPAASAPLWFVRPGDEHGLAGPCRLGLEDGTDVGVIGRLPVDLPLGYHRLDPYDGGPPTRVVCAPPACPAPPPGWGVAAQLYATLSSASQGIGDLADLATLARWVQSAGGSSILLSPLHAPSPSGPQQDSPYSPASRVWRNPLHIRVPGVGPWQPDLLDRDEVWRVKQTVLRAEFADRRAEPAWREWAERLAADGLDGWAEWCASVDGNGDADFHRWLQWCIDDQLAAVRSAAPDVALIGDVAIGFDPTGADAHEFAGAIAHGCHVGAPPDLFNPAGQDWGLPPFAPWRLRAAHYAPFVRTVRGTLRGLQGLRMDHVMGLFRQYWIPPGASPRDGAYVRFPWDELLSIVALEATRAGAFVVGEDLGTVEDGVREAMDRFGILGCQVAWFTDDPPEDWPVSALATLTTHDLPTVVGVWSGTDGEDVILERLRALTGLDDDASAADVVAAAHAGLARAPSVLKLATLDDLTLAAERPNMPGTTVERPNWRLPLPMRVEEIESSPVVAASVAALAGDPPPAAVD